MKIISKLASNKLCKGVIIYGLADAFQKALGFLTLPIFSYYILPDELGLVANFDVLVQIASYLAFTSLVGNVIYFYYDRSREKVALLVSNLIYLFSIVNVLSSIGIFFFSDIAKNYLYLGFKFQLLAIILNEFNLIHSLNAILYRLEERPIPFVTISISYIIGYTAITFLIVVYYKMGGIGKIYSHVIIGFIFVFIDLFLLIKRKYLRLQWSNKCQKELLKFGLPLVPHSIAYWMKSGLDKILLTAFCGLTANGQFSMALTFGSIYTIFRSSFNNAYDPYIQKRIASIRPDNEKKEKIAIVKQTYIIILGFFILMIPLIGAVWIVINYFLSDQYINSYMYVPWIFLSLTFITAYEQVVKFIYTVKKTLGLGIITFTCSIIQSGCTYLFLKFFGAGGVGYSMALGSFIIFIAVWIYSQKVYPMPWGYFFEKTQKWPIKHNNT